MIRVLDLISSVFALAFLGPLLIPVAIILRFTGEGEVFYLQHRVGFRGNSFALIKFATMLKDSPNIGAGSITLGSDPRVLPFGRILRKTKINELPQFLNILFGDMSLIGPRPLTASTFSAYSEQGQKIVTSVRPGLSGVGSIAFRDEERVLTNAQDPVQFYRSTIAPYKASLEQWFVENKSVKLYFLLILITAWCVPFSKSRLLWKVFPDLPEQPENLRI